MTPLFLAALYSEFAIATLLLSKGADPYAEEARGARRRVWTLDDAAPVVRCPVGFRLLRSCWTASTAGENKGPGWWRFERFLCTYA